MDYVGILPVYNFVLHILCEGIILLFPQEKALKYAKKYSANS